MGRLTSQLPAHEPATGGPQRSTPKVYILHTPVYSLRNGTNINSAAEVRPKPGPGAAVDVAKIGYTRSTTSTSVARDDARGACSCLRE